MTSIMSRCFCILFSALSLTCVACACEGKTPEKTEPEFTIKGPSVIEADSDGMIQEYSVETSSDVTWRIVRKSVNTWSEARPASGTGSGSFKITVQKNTTGNSRQMNYSAYVNGEERDAVITVVQSGRRDTWDEKGDNLFHPTEGIKAFNSARSVDYKRDGQAVLAIDVTEPIVIAVADKEYDWGFFQFPTIAMSKSGSIRVSWQFRYDTEENVTSPEAEIPTTKVSLDGGSTWIDSDIEINSPDPYSVLLPDGDILTADTPTALDTAGLHLPKPVEKREDRCYYRYSELPTALQGVEMRRWDSRTGKASRFRASLDDPGSLRFSISYYFPIKWWGNMIIDPSDNALYAVMYYSSYETADHKADKALSCLCYKSVNEGLSWTLKGKIPYVWDDTYDKDGPSRSYYGYSEPTFAILPDGSFYCVLRSDGPMYCTRSYDKGHTWTTPEVMAPNGVYPQLFRLANGILCLKSGRPGEQLRFSLDGYGRTWTDPLDLIDYQADYDSGKGWTFNTCGYGEVAICSDNSFYITYSDFRHKTESGTFRKAILFRKVTVNKY